MRLHSFQSGTHSLNHVRREEDHDQRESNRLHQQHAQLNPGNGTGGDESDYHGKQHHTKNVVEDRRSQNDLCWTSLDYAEILQHPRGDANAGRDHGCGDEDGFVSGMMSNQEKRKSHQEGQGHTCESYSHC